MAKKCLQGEHLCCYASHLHGGNVPKLQPVPLVTWQFTLNFKYTSSVWWLDAALVYIHCETDFLLCNEPQNILACWRGIAVTLLHALYILWHLTLLFTYLHEVKDDKRLTILAWAEQVKCIWLLLSPCVSCVCFFHVATTIGSTYQYYMTTLGKHKVVRWMVVLFFIIISWWTHHTPLSN